MKDSVFRLAHMLSDLVVPFPTTSEQDYRVVQYSPRYRLSFSLLNEDASAGAFFTGWDVADSISRQLLAILQSPIIEAKWWT